MVRLNTVLEKKGNTWTIFLIMIVETKYTNKTKMRKNVKVVKEASVKGVLCALVIVAMVQ